VTSWVDAGSAGAYNIAALCRLSAGLAPLHTRAFVNISSIGLVAETGEARRQDLCDPGLCVAAAEQHHDFVIGVKCRLDRFATGEMGLAPLRMAVQAAAVAGLPVMAHIGGGPPDIDDVLDLLRPGDLVTHCATGQDMSLVKGKDSLRPSAMRARERGVLFDVGHGSGGFSFAVAESMLAAGAPPDVISSDLHQRSLLGPGFDLPTCMSKLLAIGMSLEDVVRAATTNPAGVARGRSGEPAGSLAVGEPADIAIFELEVGDFAPYDTLSRVSPSRPFFREPRYGRRRRTATPGGRGPARPLDRAHAGPEGTVRKRCRRGPAPMGNHPHRARQLPAPPFRRAAQNATGLNKRDAPGASHASADPMRSSASAR
jgi:dihydroorotase